MTTYRVRIACNVSSPNLVKIYYRKDYKFFKSPEKYESIIYCQISTNETIKDIEVNTLIRFVKDYLTRVLATNETIIEFKMDI